MAERLVKEFESKIKEKDSALEDMQTRNKELSKGLID